MFKSVMDGPKVEFATNEHLSLANTIISVLKLFCPNEKKWAKFLQLTMTVPKVPGYLRYLVT